jgi:hypothetical protein
MKSPISMPSAARLATMTSPANAVAAIRDHRLYRGPTSNDSGSSA